MTATPAQTEEVTEEYLRSLDLTDLVDFLARNDISVPDDLIEKLDPTVVVDWVLDQFAA